MSIIAELLRAHVIPGFNEIEAVPAVSFQGWVARKSFKVSKPLASKEFSLDVYSHEELLTPYANDINRMASASFESINGINPEDNLPKSIGWLIIRSYYSAYFSAHVLLRLFGISCSQFNLNETRAITEVARTYSLQQGINVASGYYCCKYNYRENRIDCSQLNNTHQSVWKAFYELLDTLAERVSTSDFLKNDKDMVIGFLYQLRDGLSCHGNCHSGTWLSTIRNEVNYSHTMGAWFPYSNSTKDYERMFRICSLWRSPIDLGGVDIAGIHSHRILFIKTCVTIVAICKELLTELHDVNNQSFLATGPIRLLRHI